MSYISKFLVFTGIIIGLFGGIVAFDTSSATLHAATLSGTIIDENGDGIENASVIVSRVLFKTITKSVLTDADGSYKVDVLTTIGNWDFEVRSVGYETVSKTVKVTSRSDEAEEDFTLNFAEFIKTNDTSTIDAAVAAFKTIGTLRKEDPINTDNITSEYEGDLQTLTKQVDSEFNLTLDSDILGAIDDIRNDNETKLATQVIDKTIQRVFFISVLDRISEVSNGFNDETTEALTLKWDEAFAAFQAIFGTTDRKNKVLTEDRLSIETGSNPNLEDQITVAFIRGKTALDNEVVALILGEKTLNTSEDKISIKIQRQVIRLSLVRAFYIGVLREIEGIISNRDSDVDEAREKQKEGQVFYSIIEDWVSRDNPTGSEIIKTQLTGDVSDVVADTIVSEMSKGFLARARGELNENEEEFSDRAEAMVLAEEAFLYSNVFLEDLGLRLGSVKRDEIEVALKSLKGFSKFSLATEASEARLTISTILTSYEGELVPFEFVKTNDTSSIDAAVAAFKTIGTLRKADPIDTSAITSEYEGDLQTLTQEVDAEFSLTLDSDILGAIDDIANGKDTKLAAQVIDKTIQRVFFIATLDRAAAVKDDFAAGTFEALSLKWDEAYAAYQAIKGTAGRDNEVLTADRLSLETSSNPGLDSQIEVAFILGQKALDKNDETEDEITINIQRQVIRLSLVRAYYIGVLREVRGIISNRDTDVAEAQEKQKEGEVFYSIIAKDWIEKDNPTGSETIISQLTGDVANVVADTIVSEMSKGFIGRVRAEVSANESSFTSGDRKRAMIVAEEALLYANVLLEDLGLRLGSDKQNEIGDALNDLKKASDSSDTSKASAARQTISDVITSYESELL
ncbi:MAG: carboxypeptidase-like regulatory domain-containing protein [Candidatus Anammoxibacter sp.]